MNNRNINLGKQIGHHLGPVILGLVIVLSLIPSVAYALPPPPQPAGNCPAFNGVDDAAPQISSSLLSFTETGGLTKVISVVTSDQSAPSTGDIIPGVMMICKYPIVGDNADTSKVTDITATYNGNNGLWADDYGCGSNDCARMGRKNSDGNSNNMPMNGGTYTAGSVTFSTEPDSELIVAHINWPEECGDSADDDGDRNPETCFRTLQQRTSVPEYPTLALPIATLIGMLFLLNRLKK